MLSLRRTRLALRATLLLVLIAGLWAAAPAGPTMASVASAASEHVLVFGADDNGYEGDNTAETLRGLGLTATRHYQLPDDLRPYSSIWYVTAYAGLTDGEEERLAQYISEGGSVYLTGERPCCEDLNASLQKILRTVLTDQDVTVGGLGDIDGPFTFNSEVAAEVASEPNLLVDFVPVSPGGLDGIGGVGERNVLASNGSTAVGAVWTEEDMRSGRGRVALLMDVDWLADDARERIIENLQNFLGRGEVCSNGGHHEGFLWTGPAPANSPGNCSTLTTPARIAWTTGSDAGRVEMSVSGSGVTTDCTTTHEGNTTVTCDLTAAEEGASLLVTATDALGTSSRHYRVRPMNDRRNVPPGFAADSKWWDWPDQDGDGLPTYWEQNGVWVKGRFLDLNGLGATWDHKDLFLRYDFQAGEELSEGVFDEMRHMFSEAPVGNPDGDDGIALHVERGGSIPESIVGDFDLDAEDIQEATTYTGFSNSPGFGGGGVPQIFKWMLNFDSGPGNTIGRAFVKGDFGWTAFPVSGWEAALEVNSTPGDAADFARASNAAHELGHQLGLQHHGKTDKPVRDGRYKSIMSYSYSNFGLPGGFGRIKNRLDYSRTADINLDWETGQAFGKLTLVTGQWGEVPDFYAANNAEEIDDDGTLTEEPTAEEVVQSADPDSVTGFVTGFEIPASLSIPTLNGNEATVRAGEAVDIPLGGRDPAGAEIRYAVDHGLSRGTVAQAPGGIRFSAAADAVPGDDVLLVRAVNDRLGSAQVPVVVHVLAPEPRDDPGATGAQGGTPAAPVRPPRAAAKPRLLKARLERLTGRRDGKARLARLTLASRGATRVVATITRGPSRACRRKKGCPRPKRMGVVKAKLRDGTTRLVLVIRGRRVAPGRYVVRVKATGPGGATELTRRLTVRGRG